MTRSRRTGMPGGGGGVRRRPEPVAHMATPGYALLFAITAGEGTRTKTVVRSGGSGTRAAPLYHLSRPDPNPWYYLKIPKCVHLLNR